MAPDRQFQTARAAAAMAAQRLAEPAKAAPGHAMRGLVSPPDSRIRQINVRVHFLIETGCLVSRQGRRPLVVRDRRGMVAAIKMPIGDASQNYLIILHDSGVNAYALGVAK